MKKVHFITLLLLAGSFPIHGWSESMPNSWNCASTAKAFLLHPSKKSMLGLTSAGSATCWQEFGGSNARLANLFKRVRGGDYWAARYLAMNLSALDGGNLEDGLIALGGFSEFNMVGLLSFFKQGLLSERQLSDALTMLPPSLSDDQSGQLSIMRNREKMVMAVRCKDFSQEKTLALKEIHLFMNEIVSSR